MSDLSKILPGDTLSEGKDKINSAIDRLNNGEFYGDPITGIALNATGNVVVTGNLTVTGNFESTTVVESEITAPTFTLATERPNSNDGLNRGLIFGYTDSLNNKKWGFFGFENSTGDFVYSKDVADEDIGDKIFDVADIDLGNIRGYLDASYLTNLSVLSSSLNSVFVTLDSDQTVSGNKIFTSDVSSTNTLQGTNVNHFLTASRSLIATDGVLIDQSQGSSNLTQNRYVSLDDTVIRTYGGQLVSGTTTFNKIIVSDSIVGNASTVQNGVYTIGDQEINGTKTFRPSSSQDGIAIVGRAGGTGNYEVSILTDTLSADRTLTLANENTTLSSGTMMNLEGSQSVSGEKTFSNNILFSDSSLTKRGIQGTMASNDQWFVGGSASVTDQGSAEISTGDNATEPIYARQYTGNPLVGSVQRQVVILSTDGHSSFPGPIRVSTQASSSNEAVLAARSIASGTGLSGGGNLTQDRTLSVDTSYVMTLGTTQTVSGSKTFSSTITGSITGNAGTASALQTTRFINGQGFDGTQNVTIPVGATAGVFFETSTVLTQDYTVTENTNAMSVGPLTLADGVDVTVPSGSTWVVI